VYTAENRCFGDVGRSLSDVRDADVLLEAFDNLTEHFSDRIAPREVTTTRKVLLRRRDEATQQMFGDDQPLAEAISTLEDSLRRVPDWPLQTAVGTPLVTV
jgi:CHAD domain-containing protein